MTIMFYRKNKMSCEIICSVQSDVLTLNLNGRFDFEAHAEFVESYESHAGFNTYIVDFYGTKYLDSSALGMLLLLKDFAESHKADVKLIRPNRDIKHILNIANFDKIFFLEETC